MGVISEKRTHTQCTATTASARPSAAAASARAPWRAPTGNVLAERSWERAQFLLLRRVLQQSLRRDRRGTERTQLAGGRRTSTPARVRRLHRLSSRHHPCGRPAPPSRSVGLSALPPWFSNSSLSSRNHVSPQTEAGL